MEFSQVKYFIAAAQMQNLSKAANILNVTQSALSKSIANLEDELGILLFDRLGKKITLNDSGRKFLEHAINSVQELESAVSAAKSHFESPIIYIGLYHYSEKFMHCLKAFSKSNSDIIIELDYLEVTSFSIETNEYDMLLFPQIPLFRKYKADVIYSDPYFLAVHKTNLLAEKENIQLSDLSEQNLVFIKYGKNHFDLPYHLCNSSEISINDGIFTNDYEMQRWFISNNHAAGFVPQGISESYSLDANIILLPVLEKGFSRDIMIGFKREKHISGVGKKFADFVCNYFDIQRY